MLVEYLRSPCFKIGQTNGKSSPYWKHLPLDPVFWCTCNFPLCLRILLWVQDKCVSCRLTYILEITADSLYQRFCSRTERPSEPLNLNREGNSWPRGQGSLRSSPERALRPARYPCSGPFARAGYGTRGPAMAPTGAARGTAWQRRDRACGRLAAARHSKTSRAGPVLTLRIPRRQGAPWWRGPATPDPSSHCRCASHRSPPAARREATRRWPSPRAPPAAARRRAIITRLNWGTIYLFMDRMQRRQQQQPLLQRPRSPIQLNPIQFRIRIHLLAPVVLLNATPVPFHKKNKTNQRPKKEKTCFTSLTFLSSLATVFFF